MSDEITTVVVPPDPPPRTLLEVQSIQHAVNCEALSKWLSNNPIKWTDGELYGVTLADQQNMVVVMNAYTNDKMLGGNPVLKWNSHTKRCREFTEQEFALLSKAVETAVRPRLEYCQRMKELIFAMKTTEEVESIRFDYDNLTIPEEILKGVGNDE